MSSFFKYLFIAISLYMMLSFAANNPEKMSDAKEVVDESLANLVKLAKEFVNN